MATLGEDINESKLNSFMGQVVSDMGAAMHAALIVVGDKLGLYKAMAGAGWLTPLELAKKTGTAERYVREWLNANAASGYVSYDSKTERYQLPPEQAFALTVQDIPGAFHVISSCFKDEPKITQAFRTGEGVGWHEHDATLFFGTERFFRPNYEANLLSSWIPALDGVEGKLKGGAAVADVGCGHGVDIIDGPSVSKVPLLRIRLPQRVDRIRTSCVGPRRATGPGHVRSSEFEKLSR